MGLSRFPTRGERSHILRLDIYLLIISPVITTHSEERRQARDIANNQFVFPNRVSVVLCFALIRPQVAQISAQRGRVIRTQIFFGSIRAQIFFEKTQSQLSNYQSTIEILRSCNLYFRLVQVCTQPALWMIKETGSGWCLTPADPAPSSPPQRPGDISQTPYLPRTKRRFLRFYKPKLHKQFPDPYKNK